MSLTDPAGYPLLQYWFSEIEAFNRNMVTTSNSAAILNFFNVANDLIGRLQSHIKKNVLLAHRYAITRTKLKHLLQKVRNEDSTVMDVNNYMIDAYPKFISALNSK